MKVKTAYLGMFQQYGSFYIIVYNDNTYASLYDL